ncbi:phosphatidate cytidylyltransferase [Spirochaetia bacterium]|nr:phosphatidate cytidylyltransferase [Spirochaetia bacterium]
MDKKPGKDFLTTPLINAEDILVIWRDFCYNIRMSDFIVQKARFLHSIRAGIAPARANLREFKTEILRKSIHFLIALSPLMAAVNRPATALILAAGILGYTGMEMLRLAGVKVPFISSITNMASRSQDMGHFVMGPVTLGLGALLALLLYPAPAAAIAIYALAFGDGFASLVGKLFGRLRPAFLCGKSIEGSLACFIAVFISAYRVSFDYRTALVAALTAAAVEALPLNDYDNIALPIAAGLAVCLISF